MDFDKTNSDDGVAVAWQLFLLVLLFSMSLFNKEGILLCRGICLSEVLDLWFSMIKKWFTYRDLRSGRISVKHR